MNRIESKDNQKIKRLKSLDKRKVREQENLFFVDGKKLVDEAFKSKAEIAEIYVSDDFYQKNMSYVDKLDCDNIYLIRDGILDSLSYMSNPEGILALAKPLKWDILDVILQAKPVVILDRISDPKNAGTMIRSAEAFGMGCVFALEGTADLYNEKTIRASMGSIFRVPFLKIGEDIFSILKKAEYEIYALDMHGESIESAALSKRCAIIVGNESLGIDRAIKKYVSKSLTIPMLGMTESLNAACAAGIMMYKISLLH